MLKADPKPDCDAMTTPEVDDFLQTFWKGKINNAQDGDLKQIQTALLNGAAPLCGQPSQREKTVCHPSLSGPKTCQVC